MERSAGRSRGRPRKRPREDTPNVEINDSNDTNNVQDGVVVEDNKKKEDVQNLGNPRKRGRPPKKRPVKIRGQAMVGRYVMKEFEGNGVFLGKIVAYDSGLYRVDYEDGDYEDLDSNELREYLIGDEDGLFVDDMLARKKKLDDRVAKKYGLKVKDEGIKEGDIVRSVHVLEKKGDVGKSVGKPDERDIKDTPNDVLKVELPMVSERFGGEVDGSIFDDGDEDSYLSSDSCEYGMGWESRSETETPAIPPPDLPPSSGNVGVPEEFVPQLLSVYGFLRSFSIRLFLSPFKLDDFVGCLNCNVPNTLLDAIHVALLRALRRHLETLASDGSELASKCLRCIDWGLLDILTWPVYLVHYLMVMGHIKGDEWSEFYTDLLEKEYCTLSVGIKLTVLQILCDDALDTEEIRAEMDMREESEVGLDSDGPKTTTLESGPRKLYPRHGKNSFGKDRENANMDTENSVSYSSNSLTMKRNDKNKDTADVDEDGNVDECRLCGMDGMLLCCDGCPSAYHSRCIGVSKLSIPEGDWFCPECTISKVEPAIVQGTSLKGAQVLGVDFYAQLFLGTCDHLLVLKVSVKTSSFVRYYNRNDILKVLNVLCSSPHHAVSYLGICRAILKYWELPQYVFPPLVNSQINKVFENGDEKTVLPTRLHPFSENGVLKVDEVEHDKYASDVGESLVENVSGSAICGKTGCVDVSTDVPILMDIASTLRIPGAPSEQNPTIMTTKLSEQTELFCSTQPGLADGPNVTGIAALPSGHSTGCISGPKNGVCWPESIYMHQKEGSNRVSGRIDQKWKDACFFMGSPFKPHAYINGFVHGEFAASAAANFAVLSSDENRASEVHASDPRKAMSANVSLQTKAFASAAVRFFWPSTEKKLIEVPRERCSWCLHCKAPVTSKKACLLNAAALNATRAQMKFVSGFRLAKNVESGLYVIAAYLLYMEEILRGLIVGPFQNANYRQQWRKQVEQASTCSEIKALLLELERNLCTIALSSEWTKLVDSWMDESSVPQSACPTGSTQKRGPGRRKKHIAAVEATVDESNDSLNDLTWWRGGKIAKLVFQRGTLPCSVIKKAARQGAKRRIPGIYYADGSDVPKRSRQFIWRAAVERAKNASQLALQVRYLDHQVKWNDLLRPEQNVPEGKGPETEASAFRNALISDKRVAENKIIYGVVFGHQKHLPSRLMKSVIEKEEGKDGKDKYWFQETRIPLYLVKEFEENAEKTYLPPPKKPDSLSEHQKKQLKVSRKNIFSYLARRRDKLDMCLCASCHQDVFIGAGCIRCSICEGYCHKTCTMNSTVMTSEDVEFVTTCKKCLQVNNPAQNNSVESPTSPLAMQGQEYQNSATVAKTARPKINNQQYQHHATASKGAKTKSARQLSSNVGISESETDKKPATSDSNLTKSKKRPCHWGLKWNKKNIDDDGSKFRQENILFGGILHNVNACDLICHLCQKPYNQDLMYIRCEDCKYWYHADAVELDESKLSILIGFKCCRCRRIKSPVCPYADANPKKTEAKKIRIKGPKEETVVVNSVSEGISGQAESVPSTPISRMEEDVFIQVDDPLLVSASEVAQIPEPKAEVDFDWSIPSGPGPGPQKLPVRRQVKNERDDTGFYGNPSDQLPTFFETKNMANPPHAEWDVSNGALDDGATFDYDNFSYENADYEPQTYFSFTELLEADDPNQFQGVDGSGLGWENIPCENSRSGFMEQCENSRSGFMEQCENSRSGFMEQCEMELEPSREPACDKPCKYCSKTVPTDLVCYNCGLQIHRECSPWDKYFQEESWSCGNCRQWC